MKKLVIFVALILPVLIFLFLKFFGTNHFEVPVYWATANQELTAPCIEDYPHTVQWDSTMSGLAHKYAIVYVGDSIKEGDLVRLTRVYDAFQHLDSVRMVSLLTKQENIHQEGSYKKNNLIDSAKWITGQMEPKSWQRFVLCELVLENANLYSCVLVDNTGRIRGYYENTDEEIDRLILEIKIILREGEL